MNIIRYKHLLFEHEIADVERMGHKPVEPGHLPLFRYTPKNRDFFGGARPEIRANNLRKAPFDAKPQLEYTVSGNGHTMKITAANPHETFIFEDYSDQLECRCELKVDREPFKNGLTFVLESTVNNYDGVDPDNSWCRDSMDDFLRDVDGIIERLNMIEMHNCHIHTPGRLELDDRVHLQMLQQLVSANPAPSPDDDVRRIDILSVRKEYDDKILVVDGWNRGLCDTKFHFEYWPKYDSAKLKLEGRPLRGIGTVTSTDDVAKRSYEGERYLRDIRDYENRNTDEVMRTLLEDGFKSIDEGKNVTAAKRHIKVEDLNLDGLDDECAGYIRDMYR